ncbi:hypothetical protein [Kocuria nitroreducens]|uniref:hypothetical protein n=1 Tax=Kocuria nitroreducens TaxID=3058914 RepID=UPI0036DBB163
MAETAKGFWHTAPGMITAVAALVTAAGGLLGVLIQNDVIEWGSDSQQSGTTQDAANTPGGENGGQPGPEAATTPSTDTSDYIPWNQATADLVRHDGTRTTVKAATVGLACDTKTLAFENGRKISLEIVRSIQFDAIYTNNASADGIVALLDGRELTDPIHTWNCPVLAQNELGPVEIKLENIHRIEFHR